MKALVAFSLSLCGVAFWLSMTQLPVSSLKAQVHSFEASDQGHQHLKIDTVLYQGPLVHDTQWVIKQGQTKTDMWGGVGGTRSIVPADVANRSAVERVGFEAEPQGLGMWKMAWIDTVIGTANAVTGQRYRYTYYVRASYVGPTTDGRAPNPSRAMPTNTSFGFLQFVPANVVADAYTAEDQFLLLDPQTSKIVANAHTILKVHLRLDPAEQPPAIFPTDLEGYILTSQEVIAGQFGCDPL